MEHILDGRGLVAVCGLKFLDEDGRLPTIGGASSVEQKRLERHDKNSRSEES